MKIIQYHYGIAFFKNGKYEGRVACRAELRSKEDARRVAQRWIDAHGHKHDYRAVQFDQDGYLVWEDASFEM